MDIKGDTMLRYALRAIAKSLSDSQAISELQAMSDRDLEDIGIERYQIPCYVKGKMKRK